jgi:hypothetical protein
MAGSTPKPIILYVKHPDYEATKYLKTLDRSTREHIQRQRCFQVQQRKARLPHIKMLKMKGVMPGRKSEGGRSSSAACSFALKTCSRTKPV